MLKTYLYIPDDLDRKIKHFARKHNKSKAEVIRHALRKGLESESGQKGAEALLDLAEFAKKNNIKGPKDLSMNLDYYLWGGKKKNK